MCQLPTTLSEKEERMKKNRVETILCGSWSLQSRAHFEPGQRHGMLSIARVFGADVRASGMDGRWEQVKGSSITSSELKMLTHVGLRISNLR